MHKKLIPLVFIASSAFAQTPVAPPHPTFSKAHPVASPNRMPAPAEALAGVVTREDSLDRPVLLMDAKGALLGRFIGDVSGRVILLLSYKGKPMAVPLTPDVNAQGVTTTGGFNWGPSIFFYQSGDCSGPAYAFGNVSFGTRYVGWTGLVNGKNYIHVADIRNAATRIYNSVYDGFAGACFAAQGEDWLTPVITSVPTAPLATPPFLLK